MIDKLRKEFPEEMEDWIGKYETVKRWYPSLVKNKRDNKEPKLKFGDFQMSEDNFFMVGDVVFGSSRVTGAI